MKILFYVRHISNVGGVERVITNISNALERQGHEIVFVTNCMTDRDFFLAQNIRRIDLGLSQKLTFSCFLESANGLRKAVKAELPDIIVTFKSDNFLITKSASLFIKIPILMSQRTDPKALKENTFKKKVQKIAEKITAKLITPLADGCVFQTPEAREYFPEKLKRKSTIIDNLVDGRFFITEQSGERNHIIGVGRLSPQKNWELAFKSFSLIAGKVEDNFLLYFGENDELVNLQKYVDELGLSDRILFMGATTGIEKIVANARLFVLSSDYEGTPNALIEAMIMGVPCVSTRFTGGGAEMLIESGVNGVLVPRNDPDAMSEAMLKILTDKEFAKKIGENAKITMREKYDREHIIQQWESYILSVFERYNSPTARG